MEIDVGLEPVDLSYEAEAQVTVDAARLGYTRIWTGSLGDPFQTCALRWAETRGVVPGGIGTAIGVMPVAPRTPADLALSAAALSRLTGAASFWVSVREAWTTRRTDAPGVSRSALPSCWCEPIS